jgi:hypothetical protein
MREYKDLSLNLMSVYDMKVRHLGNVLFLTQYCSYREGMMKRKSSLPRNLFTFVWRRTNFKIYAYMGLYCRKCKEVFLSRKFFKRVYTM